MEATKVIELITELKDKIELRIDEGTIPIHELTAIESFIPKLLEIMISFGSSLKNDDRYFYQMLSALVDNKGYISNSWIELKRKE